jgi:tetratricopeptide (TPR) repeat protein
MAALPARWSVRLLALVLLVLSGCASIPQPEYGSALPPSRPERVELTAVPFFPQGALQCGPAALATVLQSAGIARTPGQLVEQIYLPQRQGSLQFELLGASRRAGAVPYVLRNQPDDLLRELAAGHPVVVLQNVGWPLLPQWHYAVVVGYDLAQQTLSLRSGTVQRLVMPIADFDRSWAKAERWAFVALPPDRLPTTASEPDYVAAAAAFERVVPALGPRVWQTALGAWPTNLFARLALGNAAYRQRQLDDAGVQYRQATVDHPQSGDAWNNLAQVLFEQGQTDKAVQAARRAVGIGGPRLATYAATLRAIDPGSSVLK